MTIARLPRRLVRASRSVLSAYLGRNGPAHPIEPVDPAAHFRLDHPDATHAPFPGLRGLRERASVVYLPVEKLWIVLGYDAVRDALARQSEFSSAPQQQVDGVLLGAEPRQHAPMRRLISRYFEPARTAELAACAAADASELLVPTFDLIEDYARPIARRAAARFVGLRQSEIEEILSVDDLSSSGQDLAPGLRAVLARAGLADTLVQDSDGLVDRAAALSIVRLFCWAATVTTERLIVRSAVALLGDTGARAAVARNPGALLPFIEEAARLYPPEPNVVRVATSDATIAGVTIPKGATVYLSLASANRDPARFDDPDRLLLDRARVPHLSFSAGAHQCIGAGLGRQLAATALRGLIEAGFRACDPRELEQLETVQGIATPRRVTLAI
jgi:cytochrome P450